MNRDLNSFKDIKILVSSKVIIYLNGDVYSSSSLIVAQPFWLFHYFYLAQQICTEVF